MIGDFNAHHSLWGAQRSNASGNTIANALDDSNAVLLNPNTPTFIAHPSRSSTLIDLAFASASAAPLCVCNIMEDSLGSNHFPVNVHLNCLIDSTSIVSHKFKISNKQWLLISADLSCEQQNICDSILEIGDNNPIEQYNYLYEQLIKILNKYSPTSKIPQIKKFRRPDGTQSGPPPAPWWNKECSEAVKKRKDMCKLYRRTATVENYDKYTQEIYNCRKVLRSTKKLSWRTYCASLNARTPTPEV